MSALGESPWFWFPLIAILGAIYLLPTIIGSIRQVEGLGWLVLFNVFFPGVGFLAGLILACGLPRREPPVAYLPTVDYSPQAGQPYYPPSAVYYPPQHSEPVYPPAVYCPPPGQSW